MARRKRIASNVVEFPVRHRPPESHTVEVLRELLALAERGEIAGLIVGAVHREKGEYLSAMTDECRDYPVVAGMLSSYLAYQANEAMGRKCRSL